MTFTPLTRRATTGERKNLSRFLQALIVATMIVLTIFLVMSLTHVITSDSLASPLELTLPAESIDSPYPDSASISEATALVDVEAGFGVRLAWWAVTDAMAILGIAFLELLRRLLAAIDDPFTENNASRLNTMVGLAIAAAVVVAIRPVVAILVQDTSGFDGFEATFGFGGNLLLALGIAALLEVWRQGVTLRTEAELTV